MAPDKEVYISNKAYIGYYGYIKVADKSGFNPKDPGKWIECKNGKLTYCHEANWQPES